MRSVYNRNVVMRCIPVVQMLITDTLAAEPEGPTRDITKYCHTPGPRARAHNKISTLFAVFQKNPYLNDFQARISAHLLHRPSLLHFWATINSFTIKYFVQHESSSK
jgi:hypothetical protein